MKLLLLVFLSFPLFSQTVITFPNSRIFLSPYAWRIDGSGAAINPTGGGYIRFSVSGTTQITANVDTTGNAAQSANNMPSLKVIVSTPSLDGTASYVQFPANNTASTPVTLISLSAIEEFGDWTVGLIRVRNRLHGQKRFGCSGSDNC